jgi:hypothetical protein
MDQKMTKFSKRFVNSLGDLVREGFVEALELGLTKQEARKIIKTAFTILGKKETKKEYVLKECKCPDGYHELFDECRPY